MKKNVTIIGVNYFPEDSAIGLYTTQKAEYLVEKGFDVTVITGFPYYPQWEIRDDYKSKHYLLKETINGVKVLRSKQYVPSNPTFSKRIIHLTSFSFGNFINLFRTSKPNIVISIIPFTTSALLGWFLKVRYKSKLWVHIQDFEFYAAIDSGLLNGNKKAIINMLLWVEKKVLKKADIVSTISYGMLNKLNQKTNVKSYYLTNWIDVTLFNLQQKEPHKYLKSKKFKILYSGNIGAKQDWEFFFEFINAIEKLKNIEVVIVGEGAEKDNVLSEIKKYKFVKHHDLVPFQELPLLLSSADLHILFQKPDVIDTVMPSKLLGMMASGKPSIIVGNADSEIKSEIEKSGGGYYFEGNSIKVIINCIQELRKNKELQSKLGTSAKNYVFKNYSKENVLNLFVQELKKL